jgi:hypothetical protein
MGQGFSLTTLSAGSANIDVPELADLQYEKSLGAARFMKAVRARHKDGLVVARVVMKPYAQFDFQDHVKRLLRELRVREYTLTDASLTLSRRTQSAGRRAQCPGVPSRYRNGSLRLLGAPVRS